MTNAVVLTAYLEVLALSTILKGTEIRVKKFNKKFPRFEKRQLEAQSMILPGFILMLVFSYFPMYGLIIAFKDYNIVSGFMGAPWVGLDNFKEFLSYDRFYLVLRNSLAINILQLLFSFPVPIIFALLLNEMKNAGFKKIVQTISYLPHFVSWVIYAGLIHVLLDPRGIFNSILMLLNITEKPILFLGEPSYFWMIAVVSGVLKGFGWSSIIYLAAISGVDQQLYDAATVDGAGRLQKMWHITLPSIKGTVAILLIFNISGLVKTGFDQIWMMHNPLNMSMSETIEIYVYKMGLESFRFSYSTAVGLSQSVVSVILLTVSNFLIKKVTEESLF